MGECQGISLPVMFVRYPTSSCLQIEMDDQRQNLVLTCDHNFQLLNENHLYEALNLTTATEEELQQQFPKEITDYLREQVCGPPQQSTSKQSQ